MHFRLTKETLDVLPHRIQGGEITYKLYPGVQVSCFITERAEMEALLLHPHFEKLLTHPSQTKSIKRAQS